LLLLLLLHYTMSHNKYFFLLIANNQYVINVLPLQDPRRHHITNGRLIATVDDHQRFFFVLSLPPAHNYRG
jgi:hypothetical protein